MGKFGIIDEMGASFRKWSKHKSVEWGQSIYLCEITLPCESNFHFARSPRLQTRFFHV